MALSLALQPQASLTLRHYGASHGSHSHAHFQVLLGLDGALELEVAGRGQRIAAGQGMVIAPGETHDFESKVGARCLVLDTADAGWASCATAPPARGHAAALARYLAQALPQSGELLQSLAPVLMLDAWRTAPRAPQRIRIRRNIDWAALALWAQPKLHQPLAVADLARQVFLSPAQFAQRCRQETGCSVMQWLRDQRLAHAAQLRDQGLAMADVALRCGYRSPSALTAARRKRLLSIS